MKKIAALLSLIFFLFVAKSSADAAIGYCNFSPEGANGQPYGDVTLSSDCVIYESVNGTSFGNLTLQNSTITLHSTLVFSPGKQISIGQNSIIYVNTGGKITQSGLCIKDADGDGYADVITLNEDPESGVTLTNPITQIGKVEANADGSCPSGYVPSDINVQNLTIVDADPLTPSATTIATSDRELLRLGFMINGVTDALAAVGDIQIVNKNLLVCNGTSCPADNFVNLIPSTGNVYVGGKVGVGTTNPAVALDVNGQTYLSDGTAGAPAFTFRSDTNTGFYRQSTDLLSFVANGQNALNISGEAGVGRIMVGNGSPVSRLQLNDDNNNAASGITFGGSASTYLQLYKSASNALALMGGNLGIGTTSPDSPLNVHGFSGGVVGSAVSAHTKNVIIGSDTYNQSYNSGNAVLLHIADYSNDTGDNVYPIYVESENNDVDFFVKSGTTNSTGIGYFGGNVGIGTAGPGNKLDVRTSTLNDGIYLSNGTAWTRTFGGTLGGSSYNSIVQAGDNGIIYSSGTAGTGAFVIAPWAAATSGIRIDGGGNLRVAGTTTLSSNLTTAGHFYINNSSPTIYFKDTNHRGAMLHNNSNLFYILRGCEATNSSTWCTVGGAWPFYINLENNNSIFGGTVTAVSDIRLKTNIKPLPENIMDKVEQLRGVYFNWKTEADMGNARQIGVIAQEVEKIFPELVITGADGYKSVGYDRLGPILIEAIKEQQAEIDSLKSQVTDLKNELDEIKQFLKMPR